MNSGIVIRDFILPVLDEIMPPIACGPNHPDKLFGKDGALDSMGLLNLVVLLEERIREGTGKDIRLVSDAALSQTHSPFATVESLANYIVGLFPCP